MPAEQDDCSDAYTPWCVAAEQFGEVAEVCAGLILGMMCCRVEVDCSSQRVAGAARASSKESKPLFAGSIAFRSSAACQLVSPPDGQGGWHVA